MSGNPRYQPKSLQPFFGYDNLFRTLAEVELANLEVMHDIGIIPDEDFRLLTPEAKTKVLDITTTQVDVTEREVTKHDIRAWILEAQKILDPNIGRWIHLGLTSYDPLETGRCLMYRRAYQDSLRPSIKKVINSFADIAIKNAEVLQTGRTHLQAALPITVGFWLASILYRVVFSYQRMDEFQSYLVGKISGAVGAHNAQFGLGLQACGQKSYEDLVLEKLGVNAAPISTQILAPEPLAYFLFSCVEMAGAFGQFGRDSRILMATGIDEINEPFSAQQSGSSTMAHKRNPLNFEGLEGEFWKIKNEFGKVMDNTISDLQRDLVGSRLMRDFPTILICLQTQLDILNRTDSSGEPFLKRIVIRQDNCQANFEQAQNYILSEPLYITLEMYGYRGAHHLVNHDLVPLVHSQGINLVEAVEVWVENDRQLEQVWSNVPEEIKLLLFQPAKYTGDASQKAIFIANMAREIAK